LLCVPNSSCGEEVCTAACDTSPSCWPAWPAHARRQEPIRRYTCTYTGHTYLHLHIARMCLLLRAQAGSGGASTEVEENPFKGSTDTTGECYQWAADGQCASNPDFMLSSCKYSCWEWFDFRGKKYPGSPMCAAALRRTAQRTWHAAPTSRAAWATMEPRAPMLLTCCSRDPQRQELQLPLLGQGRRVQVQRCLHEEALPRELQEARRRQRRRAVSKISWL
jgi:hypothetical protein